MSAQDSERSAQGQLEHKEEKNKAAKTYQEVHGEILAVHKVVTTYLAQINHAIARIKKDIIAPLGESALSQRMKDNLSHVETAHEDLTGLAYLFKKEIFFESHLSKIKRICAKVEEQVSEVLAKYWCDSSLNKNQQYTQFITALQQLSSGAESNFSKLGVSW